MIKKALYLLLFGALVVTGCTPEEADGFAIYLLEQDMPATEILGMDIEELILEDEPILSADDIILYDWDTHTIELSSEGYSSIQDLFLLPVNVSGIPFVACVGSQRIYTGAFWTPASSLIYDGVLIMHPMDDASRTIQLSVGYPLSEVFSGKDPRGDSRIMESLEYENKLK